MRILTLTVGAAALALAACQQPATEPTDASAENAAAASDAATEAAARAGAMGVESAPAGTLPPEETVPGEDGAADPASDAMGGPSVATKATAQADAEATNLRP